MVEMEFLTQGQMLYLHITSKPGFSRTLSFSQTWGKTEILPDVLFLFFGGFFGGMNNISELNHYICTFSLQ